MPRWLVVKWPDSWQKITLKIWWKFRNLTDLDIPLGLMLESDRNSHPKTSRINQSESDRNSQS